MVEKTQADIFPIIALTASAIENDKNACIIAGMDGYLNKPVELKDLATILVKNLEKNPGGGL